MYQIIEKKILNPTVHLIKIHAPFVAKKAMPGQFIILRVDDDGERLPFTIADFDRDSGWVSIIYQIVGASTVELSQKKVGDFVVDFVGPLGTPSHLDGFKRVCVIGGGVGCAIAYPLAKKLAENQTTVDTIVGFRSKEFVILEDEFRAVSDRFFLMTDDGSVGEKGLVTDALRKLIESGAEYDEVIAIGPLVMMKFVCNLTREFGIKTVVSMNPIMIDGTGMCGGCRLTVGGKTKFACVDGPDFDGHAVDFDEVIERNKIYHDFERHAYKESCNLLQKEVE